MFRTAMPKATINEHGHLTFCENDIWSHTSIWKFETVVDSVAQTMRVQEFPEP